MRGQNIILIDLDGVLNQDESICETLPKVRNGAGEFLEKLFPKYQIYVYTKRDLMSTWDWVVDNKLNPYIDDIVNEKINNFIHITSNCIKYDGDFKRLLKNLNI